MGWGGGGGGGASGESKIQNPRLFSFKIHIPHALIHKIQIHSYKIEKWGGKIWKHYFYTRHIPMLP